jgi:hypothetical protein
MFQNYVKTALRNIRKHAGTSLINIAGLAVGMACAILIMLFVFDELGYDRFHENYDRIWRVTRKWYNADGVVNLHLGQVAPGDIPRTMEFLRGVWAEMRPNRPFSYVFIDESFDRLYKSEDNLERIFRTFAWLSVGIGCLGLFGLASYSAERRTKEIGIRKVLGASAAGLAVLLSKEFTRWVLLANLVAWPAAYFAMSRWLRQFAYRADIDIRTFLLAGTLTLAVAFLTVSYQAVKAALSDPVRSLRYE